MQNAHLKYIAYNQSSPTQCTDLPMVPGVYLTLCYLQENAYHGLDSNQHNISLELNVIDTNQFFLQKEGVNRIL